MARANSSPTNGTRTNWLGYLRPRPGNETPAALRLLIAAVTGAALSLSFTGFYLAIYSWICIGVLMVAVFGARPLLAFACGFLHALCFVLTSVPWIATVLSVHGGLSRAGGWGVLLLIAAAWGILIGLFTWSVERLSQRSVVLACVGAPFLWVTFEFVRAHLPEISFPWNLLGYPAAANLALLQVTALTGIYGLSFLVVAFNALLAWADAASWPRPRKRLAILAAATVLLLLATLAGPRLVPEAPANHVARAVQLNFPEVQQYDPLWFQKHTSELEEIGSLSLRTSPGPEKPDLLIWPEAPAPFSFQDTQFVKLASTLSSNFHGPFIVGSIEWRPRADSTTSGAGSSNYAAYNSALLFDGQGQRQFVYDKIHLVPFGEYEPFPLIHRVVSSVSDEVGGFHKGEPAYAVGKLPAGHSVGVFICYEAIYPGEVRRFAAHGAHLLVNISNDGWFGRSAALEQHLRMARVRAAENRRWLIRDTNSGLTASIDPYGRIFRPLPPDVRAAADLPYDFRTDTTLYTRFGDWFAWLCVIVSVILVGSTFRKGTAVRKEAPVGEVIPAEAAPLAPEPI
jgi:apolipoprotein N-acyltransferase